VESGNIDLRFPGFRFTPSGLRRFTDIRWGMMAAALMAWDN